MFDKKFLVFALLVILNASCTIKHRQIFTKSATKALADEVKAHRALTEWPTALKLTSTKTASNQTYQMTSLHTLTSIDKHKVLRHFYVALTDDLLALPQSKVKYLLPAATTEKIVFPKKMKNILQNIKITKIKEYAAAGSKVYQKLEKTIHPASTSSFGFVRSTLDVKDYDTNTQKNYILYTVGAGALNHYVYLLQPTSQLLTATETKFRLKYIKKILIESKGAITNADLLQRGLDALKRQLTATLDKRLNKNLNDVQLTVVTTSIVITKKIDPQANGIPAIKPRPPAATALHDPKTEVNHICNSRANKIGRNKKTKISNKNCLDYASKHNFHTQVLDICLNIANAAKVDSTTNHTLSCLKLATTTKTVTSPFQYEAVEVCYTMSDSKPLTETKKINALKCLSKIKNRKFPIVQTTKCHSFLKADDTIKSQSKAITCLGTATRSLSFPVATMDIAKAMKPTTDQAGNRSVTVIQNSTASKILPPPESNKETDEAITLDSYTGQSLEFSSVEKIKFNPDAYGEYTFMALLKDVSISGKPLGHVLIWETSDEELLVESFIRQIEYAAQDKTLFGEALATVQIDILIDTEAPLSALTQTDLSTADDVTVKIGRIRLESEPKADKTKEIVVGGFGDVDPTKVTLNIKK